MKKIKELRQRLAALTTEERAQLERIKAEERAMDATEQEQYEKRAAEIAKIETELQGLERVETAARTAQERDQRLTEHRSGEPERPAGGDGNPEAEAQLRAHRSHLRGGLRRLTEVEVRALSVGSDVEGGYLGAPMQVVSQILRGVDNEVMIRGLATVYQVGDSAGMGVPTLATDVNDADWTSELATGSEDTELRFGKRELRPHPLAKRIKISNKLVRSSILDIVAFVNSRLAYKFGVTFEKAYMTGTGNMQPLGVFTASNDGISTGRDVSTGNATTSIGADGLIEAKHTLKAQYWNRPGMRWIFHRDAVKQIRKLKDGNGQYLWQPGLTQDIPARILETPYLISEYAPNTFTTGQYVGIIGDFAYYWIADCMAMMIQVLDQLYAETNRTGYIARAESDGMPVLEEAFVRVKLA